MKLRRTIVSLLGGAVLVTAIAAPVAAAPAATGSTSATAPAAPAAAGSVLALLEADGTAFDRDWYDYDILEAAARTVLGAKPAIPGRRAHGARTRTSPSSPPTTGPSRSSSRA